MEKIIMVSVICITYNHEPYIRDCLEGFVNQKTNFRYEVLIHDDASTDKTADIIREYELKYPDIIKPIYQKENQYSQGVKIGKKYIYPKLRGKYVAWCEGDDYWCDENKLQRQFDIMEANPEIFVCAHKVEDISAEGKNLEKFHPYFEITEGEITFEEYLALVTQRNAPILLFQTSSFFFRKSAIIYGYEKKQSYIEVFPTGDVRLFLSGCLCGNIYYIDKCMSYYRTNVPDSWTYKINRDLEAKIINRKKMIEAYRALDENTDYKYHNYIDRIINSKIFSIFIEQGDYKELLKKDYRGYFDTLDKKERLYIVLNAKAPIVMKFYNRLKRGS